MTTSDANPQGGDGSGRPSTAVVRSDATREALAREVPRRPSLADKESAPVLVKLPPPLSVRLAQVSWVVSLLLGACAIVYLVIIRTSQLPDIAKLVESVDDTRAQQTYDTAADILFWSFFGIIVAIALVQVTFLVSFSNRRPRMRWWLLGTYALQALVLLIGRELVAVGERGEPVTLLLLGQLAMGVLGLLLSVLPPALRWTAQRHDVRRGSPH